MMMMHYSHRRPLLFLLLRLRLLLGERERIDISYDIYRNSAVQKRERERKRPFSVFMYTLCS
jgi:hypothetical protein